MKGTIKKLNITEKKTMRMNANRHWRNITETEETKTDETKIIMIKLTQ
jgi:hypothetical protein